MDIYTPAFVIHLSRFMALSISIVMIWALIMYIDYLLVYKNSYVGYREKGLQCDKRGTRKEIENKYGGFPKTILLCTKYNEICSSQVCAKERNSVIKKRYRCLHCGRDKFDKAYQPHTCNGSFRKKLKPFEEVTENIIPKETKT